MDDILERENARILISSLTVVEAVSAFRRKYNRDDVSASEMEELIGGFFREALNEFVIVPVEESLLRFTFDLVLEDDLRTLDSLQLSAALSLSRTLDDVAFVTADEDLADIGEKRGLDTIVPQA